MDAEKLKVVGYRAQELGKLKDHASWPVLRQVVDAKLDRVQQSLLKRLMAGTSADQREIDRLIGFRAGALWVLDNPDKAEDSLNAALRKATILEEGETA